MEPSQDNPFMIKRAQAETEILTKIPLTDLEIKIFEKILSVLSENNANSTICRVAGGWVRDKLLGKTSMDIDVAMSNMKGIEIAQMLNNSLYPGEDKVGVIQQNEEKGKHLETATIRIYDVWVDFVNLRAEGNEIGTPEEDAKYRDFTINSLFYNINTNSVEDYTNGINDLKNGIIRTPIDPKETFTYDPLRILRMIRFATKYNFVVCEEIEKCLADNSTEFARSFYENISVERIEKELTKIYLGASQHIGIFMTYKYNLLSGIMKLNAFKDLKNNQTLQNEVLVFVVNATLLGKTLYEQVFQNVNGFSEYNSNEFYKKVFYYFVMTIPLRFFKEKAGKESQLLKEGLKMANEDLRENKNLITNLDDIIRVVNTLPYTRVTVGKVIREVHVSNITKILVGAIIVEYLSKEPKDKLIKKINFELLEEISKKYISFYKYLESEKMTGLNEMKPIMDGAQLISEFKISPGKEIRFLLEYLIEKQIEDPGITKEAAIEYLSKKREEIAKKVSEENVQFSKSNKKKKNKKENK